MKKIHVYNDVIDTPADLEDGERVEVIRGNGPREGESMGYATVTMPTGDQCDELKIDFEGTLR
jgi:hypothetical protein